jgi:hypothetical protein
MRRTSASDRRGAVAFDGESFECGGGGSLARCSELVGEGVRDVEGEEQENLAEMSQEQPLRAQELRLFSIASQLSSQCAIE